MTTSVTRLLGLGLTPGKLRGLQRICNDNGTLTMVATDQNNSMIKMMKEAFKKAGKEREPTYDELVLAKNTLTRTLAPVASAILVDGYYVGIVDEFDNPFQQLRLESGPHRIEVRADGYEPLSFDVRIVPGKTITYKAELKKTP